MYWRGRTWRTHINLLTINLGEGGAGQGRTDVQEEHNVEGRCLHGGFSSKDRKCIFRIFEIIFISLFTFNNIVNNIVWIRNYEMYL